jgi:hypothetical protein
MKEANAQEVKVKAWQGQILIQLDV